MDHNNTNTSNTKNLSQANRQSILSRFPQTIKLSYEIVCHKKVSVEEYDIAIAIPYGQRAYIWWTHFQNKPVCCVCELDRTNTIGERVYFVNVPIPSDFVLGTIVSGILLYKSENTQTTGTDSPITVTITPPLTLTQKTFIMDNIYMYKGISLNPRHHPVSYRNKMKWLCDCIRILDSHYILHYSNEKIATEIVFSLPYMWNYGSDQQKQYDSLPVDSDEIGYQVRHIQYMCSRQVSPLLNVGIYKKPVWDPTLIADSTSTADVDVSIPKWKPLVKKHTSPIMPQWNLAVHKPIYRYKAYFWVKADLADDIYLLYAKKSQPYHREKTLYQYACIPNMHTSITMNTIFRKIKENRNIDLIEESDSEDEFENIQEDRYVDLQKLILMECVFHKKFRHWIPIQIADNRIDGQRMVPYLDQLIMR